jgi:hypothetical protein
MMAVSNSSPLIALGKIGRLTILKDLFGRIYIPLKVYEEITVIQYASERELFKSDWIKVVKVRNRELIRELRRGGLDEGEIEAIALAMEVSADILLIDDKKGRKIAQGYGLNILGTLGVLIEAHNRGLITHIQSEIERLKEIGFWISQDIEEAILQQVRKLPDRKPKP